MSEQTTTRGRGAKRVLAIGRTVARQRRRELHVTMALADLERALQDAFDSGRDAEARVRGWQGWGG